MTGWTRPSPAEVATFLARPDIRLGALPDGRHFAANLALSLEVQARTIDAAVDGLIRAAQREGWW